MTRMLALAVALFMGCTGPMGPPGPEGPPGPASTLLLYSVVCVGFAQFNQTQSAAVEHNVYRYADGSVITTCRVSSLRDDVLGVSVYKASDPGHVSGTCVVGADVDATPSAGFWRADLSAAEDESKFLYDDPGSPFHGRAWVVECDTFGRR